MPTLFACFINMKFTNRLRILYNSKLLGGEMLEIGGWNTPIVNFKLPNFKF